MQPMQFKAYSSKTPQQYATFYASFFWYHFLFRQNGGFRRKIDDYATSSLLVLERCGFHQSIEKLISNHFCIGSIFRKVHTFREKRSRSKHVENPPITQKFFCASPVSMNGKKFGITLLYSPWCALWIIRWMCWSIMYSFSSTECRIPNSCDFWDF